MNVQTTSRPSENRFVINQAASSAQMVRQMVRDEMRRGDFAHLPARIARIEELVHEGFLGRKEERELMLMMAQFLEAAGETKRALRAIGQLFADEDTLGEELLVELRRFRTRLLLNIGRVEEARAEVDRIERVILSRHGSFGDASDAIDADVSRVTVPTWLLTAEVCLAEERNADAIDALRLAFEGMRQMGQSAEDGTMFELLSALCCYRSGDDSGIPAIAYLYRVHVVLESGVDAAVRARIAAVAGDLERVGGLSRSEAERWRTYSPDSSSVTHYLQGEAALLPPSDLIQRLLPVDYVRDSELTRVAHHDEITQIAPRTNGVPLRFEFSSFGLEEITSMLDFNMKTGPVVIDWSACDKGVIEEAIAAGAISAQARECDTATIYFNNGSYVDARFNEVDGEVSGRAVLDTIFELFRISMAGLPGVYGYQAASGPMAARVPEIVNLRPNNVNIELMRKLDHERSGVAEEDEDAITRLFDQWEAPAAPSETTSAAPFAGDSGLVSKLGLIMEAEETGEIQRGAIEALSVLGFNEPRVDLFVDDVEGSLGDIENDESLQVIEQCRAGVVSVRFSLAEMTEVVHLEAVRLILNAAAARVQIVSGKVSSSRVEITDFVAADPVTQSLLSTLRDFAVLDGSKQPLRHILLVGERGSGKEKLADLLHKWSARSNEPYVAVNFSAIPEELASAELFGARKGAYTGSNADRDGLIQHAKAGTLFLDELDEASDSLQALIKRVVQFGVFNVVGDATEHKSTARFIAATNVVDVDSLKIKKDLRDRFMVLRVPPLRERRADIRPLAERFARGHQLVLPEPALAFLERLEWKGNVRELEKVIDRACAIAGRAEGLTLDLVRRSAIDEGALAEKKGRAETFVPLEVGETLESRLEAEEIWQIKYALKNCRGNKTHVARDLGLNRQTLLNRMKRFGL